MTISVKPIKAIVEKRYLYDMDNIEGYINCTIIGISSYEQQPLTFHILVEDKYIYSDIPIFALRTNTDLKIIIPNNTLSFVNCPDINIDVFTFDSLKEKKINCYFKRESIWLKANKYYFSIDFYKDNQFVHLLALENGQFAFVPNHKINWKGEKELSNYKKSHQNWTI